MSDENHESQFLTADKFKLPPNWAGWEAGQPDNFGVTEHHVRSLIREAGHWRSGNLWDLNEDGKKHNGIMITVCERNVPGEYIKHETVMSGKECAYQCSDEAIGECENFCGKGGTCYSSETGKLWREPQQPDPNDDFDPEAFLESLEYDKTYRCRERYQ